MSEPRNHSIKIKTLLGLLTAISFHIPIECPTLNFAIDFSKSFEKLFNETVHRIYLNKRWYKMFYCIGIKHKHTFTRIDFQCHNFAASKMKYPSYRSTWSCSQWWKPTLVLYVSNKKTCLTNLQDMPIKSVAWRTRQT